jgi:hypothetical protein
VIFRAGIEFPLLKKTAGGQVDGNTAAATGESKPYRQRARAMHSMSAVSLGRQSMPPCRTSNLKSCAHAPAELLQALASVTLSALFTQFRQSCDTVSINRDKNR